MTQETSTAILVAGMHRSGTSALTGALGAMGISLGERLLAPGDDNPKGYWEHEDAVGIHERLLSALGRHWDDVRALPDDWQASEAARTASAEIIELINRDFAQCAVWAIKDPRICRFLPLWVEATKQLGIRPVVLFVARRPSEVAASIESRNHWAPPVGELLWLRHVLEAEAASRELQRTTVVYDDLLADPNGAVSVALDRLGIRHDGDATGRLDALNRLVDVSDRHHRHTEAEEPSSGFGAIAQTAYEALALAARDDAAWPAVQDCAARFDELWRTTGSPVDAVADMAHRIRMKEAAGKLEILDLSSKLHAQIRWSEQAVVLRSELRAEYQLALDATVAGREHLAGELESVSLQAAQERAEHEVVREALEAKWKRLAGELDSASERATQEQSEHEAVREALEAERDRLAGELESASARATQERAEREAFEVKWKRLASELESASVLLTRERAEHEATCEAFAVEQERHADELKSALTLAAQERIEQEAARQALAEERDRLAGELESASARATQERTEHETKREALEAKRDRLADELKLASARLEQLQAEHMSALGIVVSERNRLAGELESASTHLMREQARHATMLDALAKERNRLADELGLASERAAREQARHVEALEFLAAERNLLSSELEAATAQAEQARRSHELHARELVALSDAEKDALAVARAEAAVLGTTITELRQSWSWRVTRPLRILNGFFRRKTTRRER